MGTGEIISKTWREPDLIYKFIHFKLYELSANYLNYLSIIQLLKLKQTVYLHVCVNEGANGPNGSKHLHINEIYQLLNITHQSYNDKSIDWGCPFETIFIIEEAWSCGSYKSTESWSGVKESWYQSECLQILLVTSRSVSYNRCNE